ncbi:hypothetical protein CK203_083809 [Vitis vinifera]|uniref:Uncharacterized protein n=1 Tax=Vitis vinifera TaxID=29760 RepID=A0A438DLR3_VITVI|nr:hypothetical protein CK203_083809 [Vitis vinifera]
MLVQMVNCVGVGRFLNWVSVDARGAVGGLLLFWDNRVLEKLEVESGWYSISIRFKNCADGFTWIFSGVYGPVIGSEKEDFWEELGAICGLWEDPWCIGGDFNAVRFLEERRNAPRLRTEMRRFSEVIGNLGLRDFPLAGGPFTWIGGLNSQVASRLDRFLISNQWEDRFSTITQSALPRLIEGFKDLVKSWWNGYFVEGYSSHCIAEKLKALKKDLKKWNREVAEAKRLPLKDYKKWALLEETSWRQKSRNLFKRREFYLHETFQRSLNSTFLVLIPKKEGAEDLRDFRPISLVGSVYKLLAKVLANRLKLVMGEVISDSHQAFIQGRRILDDVLIASEALDSRLKDNTSGLLLKMDIEKASSFLWL